MARWSEHSRMGERERERERERDILFHNVLEMSQMRQKVLERQKCL
jgi:hypothetical protein